MKTEDLEHLANEGDLDAQVNLGMRLLENDRERAIDLIWAASAAGSWYARSIWLSADFSGRVTRLKA